MTTLANWLKGGSPKSFATTTNCKTNQLEIDIMQEKIVYIKKATKLLSFAAEESGERTFRLNTIINQYNYQ